MTLILVLLALTGLLFIALAIYPGELSWLSPALHARLYDSAAKKYEEKWVRHDYSYYDQTVRQSCSLVTDTYKERLLVLDLCAGTGRATEVMASELPAQTQFLCVDASSGMLNALENRLLKPATASAQVHIICDRAGHWLGRSEARFHLVAMMECSEFLPGFPELVENLSQRLIPGAVVVTTRPAGLFGWLFLGRSQHQKGYYQLFARHGFCLISDNSWRNRYRLVIWQFNGH